MPEIEIAVTVDDEHLPETQTIGDQLRALGVHHVKVMPEIGTIFGSLDAQLLPRVKEIAGVQDVREEHGFSLPPLRGDVPQ